MDIFISSLISGMEHERQAVKDAIETLGHRAVTAESFGARSSSPQVACLTEVRRSDAVVLVLAARYGTPQPSGLSATHEEFHAAMESRRPLLVFVQPGDKEPSQATFVEEVGRWQSGLFYETFRDSAELGRKVTLALHTHLVARAVAPVQPDELKTQALGMLPTPDRNHASSRLVVALSTGPEQAVLRPTEMDDSALIEDVERELLFSGQPLFARRDGVDHRVRQHSVVFEQRTQRHDGDVRVEVFPTGALVINMPARLPAQDTSLPVVLEEDVADRLRAALGFALWWLDRIDGTHRISHLALAVQLSGGGVFGWRARREHDASPHSGTMHGFGRESERDAPVMLSPPHFPRQALGVNAVQFVEDLVSLLRRRWLHD